jgi:allophanate hydrolase
MTVSLASLGFDLASLRAAYAGGVSPVAVVAEVLRRNSIWADPALWITPPDATALATRAEALQALKVAAGGVPTDLPLFGIPFAVKDNIDVAGVPTTAACPDFAYTPERSASLVAVLEDAGAIFVGKTNLDQFATGLNGTRSPYGVPRNSFNADYVPGGSSSGSAAAVSAGLVSFSLGTDTAGSGRVPAGFTNIVGLKPTRGLLSCSGVVPACRSLDCVSIFALTVEDARLVLAVGAQYDATDPYSRAAPAGAVSQAIAPPAFRFGVPAAQDLRFFGDDEAESLFGVAVEQLKALGGQAVPIDYTPLRQTAELLYQGPWVAERQAAVGDFIAAQPAAALPVIRDIIGGGTAFSAADAFRAQYRLEALRKLAAIELAKIDVLVVPTSGTIYSVAAMRADPVRLNSNLGYYTNFVNLLDLAALAVPTALRTDGLPCGVTLIGPAFSDGRLAALGARLHQASALPLGATGWPQPESVPALTGAGPGEVLVSVVGAHLSGEPLNGDLLRLGARFVAATNTAPVYRLYALPGGPPLRPGMVRVGADEGAAIALEVYAMPATGLGIMMAGIAAPLGIGTVLLADGSSVKGFLCEASGLDGAQDITHFGGWRAFRRASAA